MRNSTILTLIVMLVHLNKGRPVSANVFRIHGMIKELTGLIRTAGDYYNYGCWCSKHQVGEPLDSLDRCCKDWLDSHVKLIQQGCSERDRYYQYTVIFSNICCDSGGGSCSRQMCENDLAGAKCLADSGYLYSDSHLDLGIEQCRKSWSPSS